MAGLRSSRGRSGGGIQRARKHLPLSRRRKACGHRPQWWGAGGSGPVCLCCVEAMAGSRLCRVAITPHNARQTWHRRRAIASRCLLVAVRSWPEATLCAGRSRGAEPGQVARRRLHGQWVHGKAAHAAGHLGGGVRRLCPPLSSRREHHLASSVPCPARSREGLHPLGTRFGIVFIGSHGRCGSSRPAARLMRV